VVADRRLRAESSTPLLGFGKAPEECEGGKNENRLDTHFDVLNFAGWL
jgi:hypothetical protein